MFAPVRPHCPDDRPGHGDPPPRLPTISRHRGDRGRSRHTLPVAHRRLPPDLPRRLRQRRPAGHARTPSPRGDADPPGRSRGHRPVRGTHLGCEVDGRRRRAGRGARAGTLRAGRRSADPDRPVRCRRHRRAQGRSGHVDSAYRVGDRAQPAGTRCRRVGRRARTHSPGIDGATARRGRPAPGRARRDHRSPRAGALRLARRVASRITPARTHQQVRAAAADSAVRRRVRRLSDPCGSTSVGRSSASQPNTTASGTPTAPSSPTTAIASKPFSAPDGTSTRSPIATCETSRACWRSWAPRSVDAPLSWEFGLAHRTREVLDFDDIDLPAVATPAAADPAPVCVRRLRGYGWVKLAAARHKPEVAARVSAARLQCGRSVRWADVAVNAHQPRLRIAVITSIARSMPSSSTSR